MISRWTHSQRLFLALILKMKESSVSAPQSGPSPVELGTKSVGKLLLQYSLPAIIASLVTSLYNIIDSIFIGRGVGAMAISGLAITFPLMNLVVAFCVLIAAGGSTVSSIFLGQKDHRRATETINVVGMMCIVHGLFIGALTLIFLDPILYFFGATDETIGFARSFMRVILAATPLSYVFIGLNNLMRATGYPRKAMISALLSVGVNVILAPIFIFKFRWGIGGAAFATMLGQTAGLVWVLSHFLSSRSFVHFNRHAPWFNLNLLKRIYAIGLSPFLMNCCACLVVVFINKSLLSNAGADGNMAVGAYGIINRAIMFFVMVIFGITQGMQPILGYNYGAGNWHRVQTTLLKGIIVGTIVSTAGCLLTVFFPDSICRMFTTDATMIDIARHGFRQYSVYFAIVGSQVVITNYFQSLGQPKLSIFLSLTRQLIFLVPLLWLLPRFFGLDGVWRAMGWSDLLAGILAIATLIVMNRKLSNGMTKHNTL